MRVSILNGKNDLEYNRNEDANAKLSLKNNKSCKCSLTIFFNDVQSSHIQFVDIKLIDFSEKDNVMIFFDDDGKMISTFSISTFNNAEVVINFNETDGMLMFIHEFTEKYYAHAK